MQTFTLEAEAGAVSLELAKRGIDTSTRVRIVVHIPDQRDSPPPMALIAEQGGAFAWLADEPDLYSDADWLIEHAPEFFSVFGFERNA